jgi:dephospho-CoA kinase
MQPGDKVLIGVGGTIGSGKTLVSRIFQELGAQYVSADEIGWEVLPEIRDGLRKRFGERIMKNGTIDRDRLREIAFSDRDNLDYLNELSHPILVKKILKRVTDIEDGIVVIDAALLFDWPEIEKIVDYRILITSDEEVKEERMVRKGISRKLFRQILRFQKIDVAMTKRVKFVIDNNGGIDSLRIQCKDIYSQIKNDC